MNKRQSNEMQSIRKKLLAAIAMLLIACIMTVSSTYAWFTLSTAPEVKGITTTVGANGNLEIALGNYNTVYEGGNPASGEGTSKDKVGAVAANTTWGNLIDLSDASYGLGKITLYPTRLNAVYANGVGSMVNASTPLASPVYGTDGRISSLIVNTMAGKFDSLKNSFINGINHAGVSGIGSVSGMSPRAFSVLNNVNAILNNQRSAKAEAQGAISLHSGKLAAIALDYQGAETTKEVAAEDVAVLQQLIDKLENSNKAISESLKSAIIVGLGSSDLSNDAWELAVGTVAEAEDVVAAISALKAEEQNLVPSTVKDVLSDYGAIKQALIDAETALVPGEDGKYTWGSVKNAVDKLLNADGILICGFGVKAIRDSLGSEDENAAYNQVVTKVAEGGLEFQFAADSGIFADIADFVGEYDSTIKFPAGFKVEGINLGAMSAKKVSVKSDDSNKTNGKLGSAYTLLKDSKANDSGNTTAEKSLTDTYGYTVDLLFRTNASDSYLMLQTAAANRIYKENNNTALMGEGSNMSFTVSGEYNKAKIDGLAAGIRVVFYDTTAENKEILGIATLDPNSGKMSGDQYKMDLKLTNYTIGAKDGDVPGALDVIGGFITDDANTTLREDAVLTALAANTAKRITALVYLDGDAVDNSDVGVEAILNGKLNLQFASSASLVPMNNNGLINTVPATT